MVSPRISQTKTSSNFPSYGSERGFTLLEIMVVLGILAAILAFGVPRMNFKNSNIKSVVRELSVLSREVRNQARLKNRTYRIMFSMPADPKAPSTYWVEYADGPMPAPSQATLEQQESLAKDQRPASRFQKDEKILKKDRELPTGLYFGQVETTRKDEPQTTGDAAIYFTPSGLVERSAVQITNKKNMTWTLLLNPLTGHADIMEKAVRLKDVSRE